MSATSSVCVKCQGRMAQGFVVDLTHGGANVSSWVEGAAQKAWYGTKAPEEKKLPVGAYRCSTCGFLEFYARDEFAPR